MSDEWDVERAGRVMEEKIGPDRVTALGVILRHTAEESDRRMREMLDAFQRALLDQFDAFRREVRGELSSIRADVEALKAEVEALDRKTHGLDTQAAVIRAEVRALRKPWWEVATVLGMVVSVVGVAAALAYSLVR